MRAPFFQADPDDWRVVREVVAKPWPEAAARMDLRWLLDRVFVFEKFGDRGGLRKLPGSRALAKQWGWTHWKARQFVKQEIGSGRRTLPAQSPHTSRTPKLGGNSDTGDIPHTSRTVSAQKPPHARLRQTPDFQTSDGGSRSRLCGKVGEPSPKPHRQRVAPMDSAGDGMGNPFEGLDDDLVTTVLRVLDRELDLLRTLDHETRTNEFVADVARLVTEEARQGLPNAARWTKRQPAYPDVARVLRAVADRNATRGPA